MEACTALARGGAAVPLRDRLGAAGRPDAARPLFGREAADAVTDILLGVPPPEGSGAQPGRIACETGTSYRFRDGGAIGFDGAQVVGVRPGRADGGSCACLGASAAAELSRLFDLLPPAPPAARPPARRPQVSPGRRRSAGSAPRARRPATPTAPLTPDGVGLFTLPVVHAFGHEDRTTVRVVAREAP